jgi:hypothetical protein
MDTTNLTPEWGCCDHAPMYHGARGCDECACTTPHPTAAAPRALVKPEITSGVTPEVIAALADLRRGKDALVWQDAIKILDNAGVFAAIDEATGYDVDSNPSLVEWAAAQPVSKCTCPADERLKSGTDNHYIECPEAPVSKCTCPPSYAANQHHDRGCPGDPFDWASKCTCQPQQIPTGEVLHSHWCDESPAPQTPETVQCGHCRGDYKPKKDGTLRKHACWVYDSGLKTIVYGPLDIHGRNLHRATTPRKAVGECGGLDRNGDRCTRPVQHLGYCFPKPE